MKVIWNRPLQLYLTALVAIQLLPLAAIVPPWVFALSMALVAWKAVNLWKGVRVPSRGVIAAVCAGGLLGILATKGTLLGEDAATAGFAIIAGCKLLETNRYRDVMMAIVLCFLLLMAQLLFSQGLGMLAFLVVDAMLLVQLLLQLHPSNTSLFSFKVVAKLVLMVLPIWVTLFFVFPRFTVGFWRREVPMVTSGFSEDMNPGLITQVVQSDELAFRLEFDGREPKPGDVYFRGAILAVADGLHWTKSPARLPIDAWELRDRQDFPSYEYELFLEPIFRRWLFTLDYYDPRDPVEIAGQTIRQENGGITESVRPITGRVSYTATGSQMPFKQRRLSEAERRAYVQLPPDTDRRIHELAFELRASNGSEIQSLTNLYHWFSSNKFLFTLTPGETPDLSAFLFDTRVGFCEHYSAAAATILRAMGFPARVVMGFQGSERNELGGYFIVRNRNAHAWAEVWVQGPKDGYWQRVDLTAAVAPMRLTLGADYYRVASQLASSADVNPEAAQRASRGMFGKIQNRLRLAVDAVEMQWVRFLLTYDFEFQQRMISRFGIKSASRFTLIVIVAGVLAGAFLLLMWALQRRGNKVDPVLREWRALGRKLAEKGIARRPNEGPLDYIRRAQVALPAQSAELEQLLGRYLRLRYGAGAGTGAVAPGDARDEIRAWREAVRAFRPA